MLKTLIIDDESDARNALKILLEMYCPNIHILGSADGVKSGIQAIQTQQPDLVFLDIEMEDGTGFEVLKTFQEPSFKVIFTTAYDNFALKAYQNNALDYLLKPIDPQELERAVKKVKQSKMPWLSHGFSEWLEEKINRPFSKITLPTTEGYELIKLVDIIRLEADGNYARLFLKNETSLVITKTLKEFELELPTHQFFRPHQSHIINMNFVQKYLHKDGGCILMENGDLVMVSRRKKKEFLDRLVD